MQLHGLVLGLNGWMDDLRNRTAPSRRRLFSSLVETSRPPFGRPPMTGLRGAAGIGIPMVMAAAGLWATVGVVTRIVPEASAVPPDVMGLARMAVAGPLLLAVAFVTQDRSVLRASQPTAPVSSSSPCPAPCSSSACSGAFLCSASRSPCSSRSACRPCSRCSGRCCGRPGADLGDDHGLCVRPGRASSAISVSTPSTAGPPVPAPLGRPMPSSPRSPSCR